jgi:hypothetical protein
LAPSSVATASWTICGKAIGTYFVVAQATGKDAASHVYVAYSQKQRITITKSSHNC